MAFKFLTTPLFENTSKSTYFLVFTLTGADQQIFTLAKENNFRCCPWWTLKVKTTRMTGMLFWGVKGTFFSVRFTSLPPTVFLHIWTSNSGAFPCLLLDDKGQFTSALFVKSTWSKHTINLLVRLTLTLKSRWMNMTPTVEQITFF